MNKNSNIIFKLLKELIKITMENLRLPLLMAKIRIMLNSMISSLWTECPRKVAVPSTNDILQ